MDAQFFHSGVLAYLRHRKPAPAGEYDPEGHRHQRQGDDQGREYDQFQEHIGNSIITTNVTKKRKEKELLSVFILIWITTTCREGL